MPTLHWIGKDKVARCPQDVPYRVLEHKYTWNAELGMLNQKSSIPNPKSSLLTQAERLFTETTLKHLKAYCLNMKEK